MTHVKMGKWFNLFDFNTFCQEESPISRPRDNSLSVSGLPKK